MSFVVVRCGSQGKQQVDHRHFCLGGLLLLRQELTRTTKGTITSYSGWPLAHCGARMLAEIGFTETRVVFLLPSQKQLTKNGNPPENSGLHEFRAQQFGSVK